MTTMGTKIRERATGQVWTIVGDDQGHSLVMDAKPSDEHPKSYRIKNETTGEERMVNSEFFSRFDTYA